MLHLALPEIILALAGLLAIALDLSLLRGTPLSHRRHVLMMVLRCAFLLIIILHLFVPGSTASGMLVNTALPQAVDALLLLVLFLAPGTMEWEDFTEHLGEYCALLLFATAAMMLLANTRNLLILFLSIEFLSLSLYVLTAFDKRSREAAEAGLTYFLFGGVSAGMLLFGMSLLYGISGSLDLTVIAGAVAQSPRDPLLLLATVLLMAGFGFKIAAAPFHQWAPEVYQGAPTLSAAFIASSSKVASVFALFVVFYIGLPGAAPVWAPLVAWLAALSMLWGNMAAIAQTSVRRLLAYSAVGHAGYMLIALAAHTPESLAAVVYYVITYALATLGVFGVLAALSREKVDTLADFAGLSRRAPGLAVCLLIFMLSLAGVPPLAGFLGKFYVFAAALRQGLLWLVLLALATSVISFYYYLRVLKQVWVCEPAERAVAISVTLETRVIVWSIAAMVVLLGSWPGPLLTRLTVAAQSFLALQ